MSKPPGVVRAKTKPAAPKPAKREADKKSNNEDKVDENVTANDEEMARMLQEQMLTEQEESDLELARRLQQEEEEKQVMFRPHARMQHHSRPMSATPIHTLFQRYFGGMLPQPQQIEGDEEETTPAMEPGTNAGAGGTSNQATNPHAHARIRVYGNRNQSPRRQAGRSPERARRRVLGFRPVGGQTTQDNETSDRASSNSSNEGQDVTEVLPGVMVNPDRYRHSQPRPLRRFMFGRPTGLAANQEARRHIAPAGRLLLGERENTLDLPDGELDPEMMVMDGTPSDNTGDDDFIHIMRDPFLLLLLLSARDPNFLVPDDVDVGNYEAMWELAERLGEVRNRGMNEADIQRLPTRTYMTSQPSHSETCSICLTEYKSREKVTLLPCSHEYHQKCVGDWLKRNATCPVCRKDVKEASTKQEV